MIYRAVSSWFVKVTEFRDRMVELNQQITWYPEHVKDGQFGKWLQGARDWSISRNRYWGSPIPVWTSDDPAYPRIDVYGSLDELERDFGVRPNNLHRPYIDELTRPNPDDPTGTSTMRRIPDVFDVWFDSGSMPYAQVHYPFENADWFDSSHFPADFIVEYIGQTRGWFYTLHVLATALFDRPAFKTCVSHGIVLGNDGQKMSKSLRNYPDVTEVFDRDGSDAMRWFLMASPILRGGNLIVTEQGIREGVRQVQLPIWNAYTFLALYAPKKGTWRTNSTHVLDRYILAKLAQLRDDLTASMDVCDISGACDELRQFTEALTNWYVRRSRSRFWEEDPDAIDTLHTVLEVAGRLAAPLLPLTTEVIWRGITGERSVHLTDWPESGDLPHDADLVAAMDQVREVASAASSLRKAKKLRVRLPLLKLTVAVENPQRLEPFRDLLADELNVKEVELTDDIASYGRFELTVNARAAGPRIGKDVQAAIKAVKAGEGVVNPDGTLTAGPAVLLPEEFSSRLVAADPEFTAALPEGSGLVVLDGTVTPELEAEGWAKDRIRELQELRRTTGLDVSDRISVVMAVPDERDGLGAHARRADRAGDPGDHLRVRRARRRQRNRRRRAGGDRQGLAAQHGGDDLREVGEDVADEAGAPVSDRVEQRAVVEGHDHGRADRRQPPEPEGQRPRRDAATRRSRPATGPAGTARAGARRPRCGRPPHGRHRLDPPRPARRNRTARPLRRRSAPSIPSAVPSACATARRPRPTSGCASADRRDTRAGAAAARRAVALRPRTVRRRGSIRRRRLVRLCAAAVRRRRSRPAGTGGPIR